MRSRIRGVRCPLPLFDLPCHTWLMTFAVLADIHGNAAALGAVLADMERLGITQAVNLGDHFSGPLDAAKTADLLMARDFPSILGNHDRWMIEQDPSDMGASDKVAFDQLGAHQMDWLKGQPATLTVYGDVLLCHGTPTSDTTYWLERVNADGSVRSATLAEIEREAKGIDASLILCGHTHTPRLVRMPDGRVILNPGSVGCPAYDDDTPVFHLMMTGTPNASYAIAERAPQEAPHQTPNGWNITFRSVPYDTGAMVDLAKAHGRDEWAQALESGWISSG